MKFSRVGVVFVIFILILQFDVSGKAPKSRRQLEKKRKQTELEITQLKKQIKELKNKVSKSKDYQKLLDKKITARKTLISNYQQELTLLDKDLNNTGKKVDELNLYMDTLKSNYALMIKSIYKTRLLHSDNLMLINRYSYRENLVRLQLSKYYFKAVESQAEEIKSTQADLSNKLVSIQEKKSEREKLLAGLDRQKRDFEMEMKEQENAQKNLSSEKQKLTKKLRQQQKEAQQLEKAISNAISKEFSMDRKSTGKATKPTEEVPLSPENQKISNNFSANKGRLPWPIDRGYICERYGKKEHPEYKDVIIVNNGIKFCTPKGTMVKAIAQGEVRYILPLQTGKKFILIKHGDYFTVYSNLQTALVKAGQKISIGQTLGSVGLNDEANSGLLEIQVRKGCCNILNPEQWILRQ